MITRENFSMKKAMFHLLKYRKFTREMNSLPLSWRKKRWQLEIKAIYHLDMYNEIMLKIKEDEAKEEISKNVEYFITNENDLWQTYEQLYSPLMMRY
jgi:hypothetical protein